MDVLMNCPACGARGSRVRAVTLELFVAPAFRPELPEGRYRFCATPGCPVVYFAEDGGHVVGQDQLVVRVGVKATEGPRTICYCFGHTLEEMEREIRETGRTTVPEAIRRRLDTDGCDCERKNPQGSCCLGAVLAAAEAASRQ